MVIDKPKIFNKREDAPANAEVIDAFQSSLRELFLVDHPFLKDKKEDFEKGYKEFLKKNTIKGIWIYFPWNNKLVHSLPEDLYFKLRTNRNQNIITAEEQVNYRNVKMGIAGLSVGSSVLHALVMSGGPKTIKIADFDVLEATNLNRIRAGLADLGSNKTVIAARQVWDLDPFADLYLFGDGLTQDNLKDFILGDPKLDIFIDEMDSLDLKAAARIICKENKIPVLMATDNGNSVLLDVERFDLEVDRPIFHGLVDANIFQNLKNLDYKSWVELANKIIGYDFLEDRMKKSLVEIGKTILAVPQLGSTAAIAGGAISYAVREIANDEDLQSGKFAVGGKQKII